MQVNKKFYTVVGQKSQRPQLFVTNDGERAVVLFGSETLVDDFIRHWETSGEVNIPQEIPFSRIGRWLLFQQKMNSAKKVTWNPSPDRVAYPSIPVDVLMQAFAHAYRRLA